MTTSDLRPALASEGDQGFQGCITLSARVLGWAMEGMGLLIDEPGLVALELGPQFVNGLDHNTVHFLA